MIQAPDSLIDEIIDESQQILLRLVDDHEKLENEELCQLQELMHSRQAKIQALFNDYQQEELAPLSDVLRKMSDQDLLIVSKAFALKQTISKKMIAIKQNKKAVKSYGKY